MLMHCFVITNKYMVHRPGDYGSMVNEVVGTGDWEEERGRGREKEERRDETHALTSSYLIF